MQTLPKEHAIENTDRSCIGHYEPLETIHPDIVADGMMRLLLSQDHVDGIRSRGQPLAHAREEWMWIRPGSNPMSLTMP